MKKTKTLISALCTITMLISTCIAGQAGFGCPSRGDAGGSVPPRAWTALVSRPLTPTQQLVEEPQLTALTRRITGTPGFSGAVIPGQTLDVTLNRPPELGGATPRHSRPGEIEPLRPAPRNIEPRPVTPSRRVPESILRQPVHVLESRDGATTPSNVLPAGPTDEIPCQSLPGGCPPPVPVPDTPPGAPQVQLNNFAFQVKWGVFEVVNGRRGAALAKGTDFQSQPSQGLACSFVLAPQRVAEYTGAPPPANPFVILALVTVTADKDVLSVPPTTTRVTSAEVPVEVPLSLSALAVPKVFVLFLDKKFGGAAAIYLPVAGGIPGADVQDKLFGAAGELLATYRSVASRLQFVSWFASYITGLEALQAAGNLPHVDLKERKDGEPNLNTDDFIERSPYTSVNDTEVEDESSSLLLLGPPGTQVQFFQDRGFDGGAFDVRTSNPIEPRDKPPTDYAPGILIRDFDNLRSEPAPGKVTIVTKFTVGEVLLPTGREVTPNDRLSSFKWLR